MDPDASVSGRRRLAVGVVIGLVLLGALIALQMADDSNHTTKQSTSGTVRVKGIEVTRPASLAGRITNADGWRIEITVVTPDGQQSAVAEPNGRYRVTGLSPGPAAVSWVAESASSTSDGISLASQRTGRTEVQLGAGRNPFDFAI